MGRKKEFVRVCILRETGIESSYGEDIAGDFRMMARLLRDRRNMPFAFYGNSSGGIHTGFFFKTKFFTWEEIEEYISSSDSGLDKIKDESDNSINDLTSILRKFVDIVKKKDPEQKYDFYKLCD